MENKTGMICLILLVISGGLLCLESPYRFLSILTISATILIPMIKGMWEVSGWASNQFSKSFNDVQFEISYTLDENSKNE